MTYTAQPIAPPAPGQPGPQGFMPFARFWNNGEDDNSIDLRRLLMLVWRRKFMLLGSVMGVIALTFVLLLFVEPRYTARSYIKIQSENLNPASVDLQDFMTQLRLDTALVLSEVEVLKSRELARAVILSPKMAVIPEYKALQDRQATLKPTPATGQTPMGVNTGAIAQMPAEMLDPQLARAIDEFLYSLSVRAIPGSFVVQVNYDSTDSEKAALIANVLADTYIDRQLEQKFSATQKVTGWLDQRLNVLREQVRNSEQAIEDYKRKNNMLQGARFDVTSQQLSELNSQLVLAKAERAEAEAKLGSIGRWLQDQNDADLTSDILQSNLIVALKQAETGVLQRRAELTMRYGARHPNLQASDAELANIREKIAIEMRSVANVIEGDLRIADIRVKTLEDTLGGVEGVKIGQDQAMVQLRELEREAASNRIIYDAFMERYKRSTDQEQLEDADAEIISYASVPRTPSYPNHPLFLTLAAAMGLFGGIMLILMFEKMDNTFRSSTQLEQKTGFSCYALVPQAEAANQSDLNNFILRKPTSAVAESLRTLRMSISLRGQQENGGKPKVISITSSLPNEGKSTLSYWLGRQSAKSGEKVIVIDCDLRRPSLHTLAKRTSGPTLVDFLTGQAKLEDIIHRDEATGLHIISARAVPNTALDLLQSDTMHKLLVSLRSVYDLVILDTPASLAVSDARVLALQSDFLLYVVHWDQTSREVVTSGLRQFTDFGYNKIGLVINQVDIRRHAAYGYGDTAYYYGRFKEYHQA
jgi:succinoglycan biosynthesis transport protein ExoP